MRAGLNDKVARPDLFFACEKRGFEDYFDRAFISGFHDIAQLAQNVGVVAVLEAADIYNNIQFLSAVIHRRFDFKSFGIRAHGTERKPDRACDFYAATFENGVRLGNAGSIDTYTPKSNRSRIAAELFDFLSGSVGLE